LGGLMKYKIRRETIDLLLVGIANLINIIMVGVFIMRSMLNGHLAVVGIIWVIFIMLLLMGVVFNINDRREWWAIVIPLLLGIFLILEVVLDYILKLEFRNTPILGPYLLLYYVSILGMIGYSFRVEKKFGFITLVTYFLSQFAALSSYFIVGHG
jgi:hypothetical protein